MYSKTCWLVKRKCNGNIYIYKRAIILYYIINHYNQKSKSRMYTENISVEMDYSVCYLYA